MLGTEDSISVLHIDMFNYADLISTAFDLRVLRKRLHDSIEIPSNQAVEHFLSALSLFLLRTTTISPQLVVPDPQLA
jgi:hypothetical protein